MLGGINRFSKSGAKITGVGGKILLENSYAEFSSFIEVKNFKCLKYFYIQGKILNFYTRRSNKGHKNPGYFSIHVFKKKILPVRWWLGGVSAIHTLFGVYLSEPEPICFSKRVFAPEKKLSTQRERSLEKVYFGSRHLVLFEVITKLYVVHVTYELKLSVSLKPTVPRSR